MSINKTQQKRAKIFKKLYYINKIIIKIYVD